MAKFSKSKKKVAVDLESTKARMKESLARGASPPPRLSDKVSSSRKSRKGLEGKDEEEEDGISWKTPSQWAFFEFSDS